MAAPVPLRSDYDPARLRGRARQSRDPDQTRRRWARHLTDLEGGPLPAITNEPADTRDRSHRRIGPTQGPPTKSAKGELATCKAYRVQQSAHTACNSQRKQAAVGGLANATFLGSDQRDFQVWLALRPSGDGRGLAANDARLGRCRYRRIGEVTALRASPLQEP